MTLTHCGGADAINLHFARWDLSHLHDFKLADGREIGFPDPDSPDTLDQVRINVSSALSKGEEFEFVFDFGDDWTHQCRVDEVGVDPNELYGESPQLPVPIWGWGSIPDYYAGDQRTTPARTWRTLEGPATSSSESDCGRIGETWILRSSNGNRTTSSRSSLWKRPNASSSLSTAK